MKFILAKNTLKLTTVCPWAGCRYPSLKERLNQTSLPGVSAPEIPHGDVAAAYLGLLCQGKSDFDSIEPFREEPFFQMAWANPLQPHFTPEAGHGRQKLQMAANYPGSQPD